MVYYDLPLNLPLNQLKKALEVKMVEKQRQWINNEVAKEKNPIQAIILALETEKNIKGYTDYILVMKINLNIYCMSIYGTNLNTLIDKYGNNENNWINKEINILFEQKGTKLIKTIF